MSAVIMVVEDDPIPAAMFQRILESHGFGVRLAVDAETAMDLVATDLPSLLLLDLILPGMDGLEMLQRLREDPLTQGLGVILTSGGGQGLRRAAQTAATRIPYTWFVEKGASIEQLLATITIALHICNGQPEDPPLARLAG
ncbi:MAG: response regulator [Chloroflexota bacterium]|nr:response regulator [Chloroflexota bacterium]